MRVYFEDTGCDITIGNKEYLNVDGRLFAEIVHSILDDKQLERYYDVGAARVFSVPKSRIDTIYNLLPNPQS